MAKRKIQRNKSREKKLRNNASESVDVPVVPVAPPKQPNPATSERLQLMKTMLYGLFSAGGAFVAYSYLLPGLLALVSRLFVTGVLSTNLGQAVSEIAQFFSNNGVQVALDKVTKLVNELAKIGGVTVGGMAAAVYGASKIEQQPMEEEVVEQFERSPDSVTAVGEGGFINFEDYDPSLRLPFIDPTVDESTLTPLQFDYANMEGLVGTPNQSQMSVAEMLHKYAIPFGSFAWAVAGL